MPQIEPEALKAQLNDLRARVVSGQEVTDEELKAAVHALIARRLTIPEDKPKKKKEPSVKVDLSDLE